MDKKVILVAGAAGFIPSTLSEFYLKQGHIVLGLDNFITGSRSNVAILNQYKNFKFYECNIYESLPDFKNQKIDEIFSLASPASPVDFQVLPMEILRVNSEGTMHLLDLAMEKNAKFLEASTSEVYGDPEIHPQPEEYFGNVNTIGPRSCYDESKRYAEALTMNYNMHKNVNTRIVRIFNTYGPRMRPNDGRVIPNFINQALRGEDLIVYGDGSQTRSFCYVDDLVCALDIVMNSSCHTPVNIGNPDEYSIYECALKIIEVLHSKSKVVCNNNLPKDDPKKRKPDIRKLKSLASYEPQISFSEGMKRTAEYFKHLV